MTVLDLAPAYPRQAALRQHERRESNPQPPVLETGALPVELRSYLPEDKCTFKPSILNGSDTRPAKLAAGISEADQQATPHNMTRKPEVPPFPLRG